MYQTNTLNLQNVISLYYNFKNHYQIFIFSPLPDSTESTLHLVKVDFLQLHYTSVLSQVSFPAVKIKLSFCLMLHHAKTTGQIVIKNGGILGIIWGKKAAL